MNSLPLAWSSVHWMMHPETASSLQWWMSRATAVLYVVTAIFFAYGPPAQATASRTIARLVTILLIIAVFPFATNSIQKFWHIRPDSWDLLLWRLDDDWNEGRVFDFLGDSIAWLIAIGALWLIAGWRNVALQSTSVDKDVTREKITKSITIQRLMALTAMAAGFAAILRWLQWSASPQEFVRMTSAVPIALSIASVGKLTQRPGHQSRFWGWVLGVTMILLTWVTWFAHGFFTEWHFRSMVQTNFNAPVSWLDVRFRQHVTIANDETIASIGQAMIAWTLFAVLGYRLERTSLKHPASNSSEPAPR
ncbi:hypothetical protein [Rhodopirellula islandica]|nr:hypothetical protein [Rhodopirellula islandica]